MAETVNQYEVLGVPRSATTEEIRKRFRDLARERHPDRSLPGEKSRAEAEFQSLTAAYNVLMSPARRAALDFDLDNKVVSESDPGRSPRRIWPRAWRNIGKGGSTRRSRISSLLSITTRKMP